MGRRKQGLSVPKDARPTDVRRIIGEGRYKGAVADIVAVVRTVEGAGSMWVVLIVPTDNTSTEPTRLLPDHPPAAERLCPTEGEAFEAASGFMMASAMAAEMRRDREPRFRFLKG